MARRVWMSFGIHLDRIQPTSSSTYWICFPSAKTARKNLKLEDLGEAATCGRHPHYVQKIPHQTPHLLNAILRVPSVNRDLIRDSVSCFMAWRRLGSEVDTASSPFIISVTTIALVGALLAPPESTHRFSLSVKPSRSRLMTW
ncbi:hypothetical protein E2C01_021337 [Portunus trituberculatus]|uniref:Uncharacterized protein n=1 Tax=Portunus trituberculatus TaxID=210409 RepID=A0A5B7E4E9_PORTR|nr:hypothetical protein [Portunus trituberculatus]